MKLNLGAGPAPPLGWVNVDIKHATGTSGFDGDFRILPYEEGYFEYAVCHHAFQQVDYVDLVPTLREWRRVLKPGGVLRMSVPDLRGAIDAWLQDDAGWFPIVDDAERCVGGKLAAYVTWYSEARTVFTRGWLAELCVRAGFAQTAVCVSGLSLLGTRYASEIVQLDTRGGESIYMEAQR